MSLSDPVAAFTCWPRLPVGSPGVPAAGCAQLSSHSGHAGVRAGAHLPRPLPRQLPHHAPSGARQAPAEQAQSQEAVSREPQDAPNPLFMKPFDPAPAPARRPPPLLMASAEAGSVFLGERPEASGSPCARSCHLSPQVGVRFSAQDWVQAGVREPLLLAWPPASALPSPPIAPAPCPPRGYLSSQRTTDSVCAPALCSRHYPQGGRGVCDRDATRDQASSPTATTRGRCAHRLWGPWLSPQGAPTA